MSTMRVDDYENLVVLLSLTFLLVVSVMFVSYARDGHMALPQWAPVGGKPMPVDPKQNPAGHAKQAREVELKTRFEQAVMMLHAKQYDHAITALHRVLALSPKMPEAHANMGFALLGLKQYKAAHDFFNSAIELNSYQANAYFGLGMALEGLEEYEGALGAMRAYIHLSTDPGDPFIMRARAAIWEWELKLGRLPPVPEDQLRNAMPIPSRAEREAAAAAEQAAGGH